MSPEELIEFVKIISNHENEIDAEQDILDSMGLWTFAELRPPDFDDQLAQFIFENHFTGEHPSLHFQVNMRVRLTESVKQRMEIIAAAKQILADNGTPYRSQDMEPIFADRLEAQLKAAELHIEKCEAELQMRKIRGRADGIFDEQPTVEIIGEMQNAKNQRRKCLRRLGRDNEAAPVAQK